MTTIEEVLTDIEHVLCNMSTKGLPEKQAWEQAAATLAWENSGRVAEINLIRCDDEVRMASVCFGKGARPHIVRVRKGGDGKWISDPRPGMGNSAIMPGMARPPSEAV